MNRLKKEWESHPARVAAVGLLGISIAISVCGYIIQYGLQPSEIVNDFYSNMAVELASIVLTVLLIDYLYDRRAEKLNRERRLKTIIHELTSA